MRSRTSRSKHQPVLAASGASWRLLLFSVLIGLVLYAKQSSLSTALLRWRHSRPHADDLINWIKSNGGVVRATGCVLSLIAAADDKPGHVHGM